MLKFLLDTDIAIYTIKNRPEVARLAFNQHSGQMAVSAVTQMELLFGAERSSQPARNTLDVETFLARLDVLVFDGDAAAQTAQIRAELTRLGTPIGPYDAMIAGQARARGLIVVTNNVREFKRVPGLRVENWVSTP